MGHVKRWLSGVTILLASLGSFMTLLAEDESLNLVERSADVKRSVDAASFEVVRHAIGEMPEGSLVILDCTRTLMEPVDAILRYGKWAQLTEATLGRPLSVTEARYLKLLRDWQSKKQLTHPDWPVVIQAAAARGVHLMVLTKHPVGYVDEEYPPFEGVRIQQMRALGLDFRSMSPRVDLQKMKSLLPGREVSYAGGILFAPDGMKGPIVDALLQSSRQEYTKILIVDDSETQCLDMEQMLTTWTIDSAVLRFTEANDRRPSVDPSVAALQLRTLFQDDVWLSDEAASLQIQQQSPNPSSAPASEA